MLELMLYAIIQPKVFVSTTFVEACINEARKHQCVGQMTMALKSMAQALDVPMYAKGYESRDLSALVFAKYEEGGLDAAIDLVQSYYVDIDVPERRYSLEDCW